MNAMRSILLILFLFLTVGLTCDCGSEFDEYAAFENIYDVLIPFEIAPLQKEYQVNDTIVLSTIIENREFIVLV